MMVYSLEQGNRAIEAPSSGVIRCSIVSRFDLLIDPSPTWQERFTLGVAR